jgi:hypothetical protein
MILLPTSCFTLAGSMWPGCYSLTHGLQACSLTLVETT